MNIPVKFLLVSVIGVALSGGGAAHAATPTPTSTATPAATSTPSPQQVDTFRGQAWLGGRGSGGPITAKIGGAVCSEPSTSITPADSTAFSIYTVRVLSSEVRPGCGQPGAVITFLLAGQQASQTAMWQAGGSQFLTLIAGGAFARISGTVSLSRTAGEPVVPFVNGQACGYDSGGGFVDPEHNYSAVVFSNEQQAGCGTEGAQVTFKVLDAQGDVIAVANEKATWHAWDGVSDPYVQRLILTFGPAGGIKLGNVGTGGSQESGTSLWGELSVVLGAIGLGGIAAGAVLRRRAIR